MRVKPRVTPSAAWFRVVFFCFFFVFLLFWFARVPLSPQDDPHLGMRELKACTEGCSRSMFVGITCGISAAYVLGQVEYGMQTDG